MSSSNLKLISSNQVYSDENEGKVRVLCHSRNIWNEMELYKEVFNIIKYMLWCVSVISLAGFHS